MHPLSVSEDESLVHGEVCRFHSNHSPGHYAAVHAAATTAARNE
jgi:hypothetical protein